MVEISGLKFHLKCGLEFVPTEHFVCLVAHKETVLSTAVVNASGDSVIFQDTLTFDDLATDFVLDVTIYCLKQETHHGYLDTLLRKYKVRVSFCYNQ